MSLINDALKKTQRMRAEPGVGPSVQAGYAGPRRGRVESGPSLLAMVIVGILLVVCAVGGTVWLLKSKSTPATATASLSVPAPVAIEPAPPPDATKSIAPALALPAAGNTLSPPIITLGTFSKPDSKPVAVEQTPVALPLPAEPAAVSKFAANPNAKPRADVSSFVDSVHVTGVRFSETGSKVLMNDHLFKVNDIVDRMLNVRLVEVKTDSLTFLDENGAVYQKNF